MTTTPFLKPRITGPHLPVDPLNVGIRIEEFKQHHPGWLDGKGEALDAQGFDWLAKAFATQFFLLISPLLILLASGCRDQTSPQDSTAPGSTVARTDEETATKMPGISIALDASPMEVAQAALQAIEAGDKQALKNLVAVKKVTQDIEAISRGRAAFQGMVANAIPTAVSAIMLEINGLDAAGREIDQETITGDTAVVTVKGIKVGQAQTRRFFLVKEDNQWRLAPSHR